MNLFGGAEEVIMNLFKEVKTMQVLGQFGQPGVPARFHAEEVHFHFYRTRVRSLGMLVSD